ncbi:hypothetical protein AX17_005142 [Amanita inopinata Kibby_2008]|nr:hypothetical protein AX17_005142 [Amanita inopinata Kibby_2008]
MSFFSTPAYKPHIRQEGFHLPSPAPSSTTPPPNTSTNANSANGNAGGFDIFNISSHHLVPDVFRKFPSAASADNGGMDFDDELASLIGPPPQHQSNERSTQSPIPNPNGAHHAHSGSFDDGANGTYHHRPQTHNIFDISAPTSTQQQVPLASSASSTASAFSSHFSHLNDVPPSSFPHHFSRHTPSPINSSHQHQHSHSHSHAHSRSRSRSRPPSGGSSAAATGGGVGPARTTRSRRNNSVSSTSPPPHGRPQAIVIPGSRNSSSSAGGAMSPLAATGGGWFIPGHASASDYSLSESLHSHSHHHSHSQSLHHPAHNTHQGYTPFSLSPPNNVSSSSGNNVNGNSDPHSMHLPSVSALHPHSLPKTASVLSGGDPNHHHFSPSTSSSGLPGSYGLNGLSGLNGLGGLGNLNVNVNGGLGPGSPVSPTSAGLNSPLGLGATSLAGVNGANVTATAAMSAHEKQAALVNEKRRRRRESHNAVERRRRDNINEKIGELATLIPECMLDTGNNANGNNSMSPNGSSPLDDQMLPCSPLDMCAPSLNGSSSPVGSKERLAKKEEGGSDTSVGNGGSGGNGGAEGGGNGVMKANKGMILRKSVEYIRYLQQLVSVQGARNRELEAELKAYRAAAGVLSSPSDQSPSGDVEKKGSRESAGHDTVDAGQAHPVTSPSTSPRDVGSDGEMNGMVLHDESSKNGVIRNYSSFGAVFGLPSMPEGEGEEDEGIEGGSAVGNLVYPEMDGVEGGVKYKLAGGEGKQIERGRTRMKNGIGKIKEEHDMAMET